MGALNQYNTDKQRYDESLRRLEEWKKEVDFDSKTTKVKKEEGLANTFKREHHNVIMQNRNQLVASLQKLVNSSSLDDSNKQIVNDAVHHLSLFESSPTTTTFRKITGPMKPFEDSNSYAARQKYQALKSKNDTHARVYAANYRSGLLSFAHALCAVLEPTPRNKAIIDYFCTKSEAAANKVEVQVARKKEKDMADYDKKKEKIGKVDEDVEESTRRLLNWLVLKEYDGKGNQKFVQCKVTGDQLTLTDIKMRKKSKKRKRGRSSSLVGMS